MGEMFECVLFTASLAKVRKWVRFGVCVIFTAWFSVFHSYRSKFLAHFIQKLLKNIMFPLCLRGLGFHSQLSPTKNFKFQSYLKLPSLMLDILSYCCACCVIHWWDSTYKGVNTGYHNISVRWSCGWPARQMGCVSCEAIQGVVRLSSWKLCEGMWSICV